MFTSIFSLSIGPKLYFIFDVKYLMLSLDTKHLQYILQYQCDSDNNISSQFELHKRYTAFFHRILWGLGILHIGTHLGIKVVRSKHHLKLDCK